MESEINNSQVIRSILACVAILIVAFFLIYPRYLDWRTSNVRSGTEIPETLQDSLTIQDIAWYGMNPDKTCWKHFGSPCQYCDYEIGELFKAGSKNMVIGKTAHIAALKAKEVSKNIRSGGEYNFCFGAKDTMPSRSIDIGHYGGTKIPDGRNHLRNIAVGDKMLNIPSEEELTKVEYKDLPESAKDIFD